MGHMAHFHCLRMLSSPHSQSTVYASTRSYSTEEEELENKFSISGVAGSQGAAERQIFKEHPYLGGKNDEKYFPFLSLDFALGCLKGVHAQSHQLIGH